MRRHFFSILSIASKNPNTSPKPLHHLNLFSPPKHRMPPDQSVSTVAQESKPTPTDTVSAIVDEISGLTLLEVSDLTELLRQRFDVGEMPIMAVMMPGMSAGGLGRGAAGKGGAAKAEEKAEKTAFDLKLESFDAASKIKIIKEVRTFTDLGLKEAKELVEKAPALLKKGVTKEEAQKIVEKMKEVGAKVVME
ncbi:50S ribosomal protein L7/L12-like protein [Cinnamomum micranthum f. kanehirae]|uniref:50S ribosomal protein L7/L12-like protein n=1 Tax=Cinnamomum micranthum f. kanehirae TaxID=337451 RepID=A0A3S3MN02_9MAGN|nr:50S ribosomal protein L7/L12-like protein [Cinnamomum micranthum f. kanehirae]